MRPSYCTHGIDRRSFSGLALAATGLSLLSIPARAGKVSTLCVTCIDYRFVNKDVTWLNTELGLGFDTYDIVALAGASLAAIPTRVEQSPSAFWDQVKLAIALHHIENVILLDHMDCGAYRVAYGKPAPPPIEAPKLPPVLETAAHKRVLPMVAGMIRAAPYNLQASGYLIDLKGVPQKIA